MTLHKQWARPFVGCFAFLGFKLPLNVKSIWLSLEQLYMCKCIWVWLPLFPLFFPSFPFFLLSLRWCNSSLIHANTCFFKRRREERKKERPGKGEKMLAHAALYHNQHEHQSGTLWLKLPQNKEKMCRCCDTVHHSAQIKSAVYVNLDRWRLERRLSR